ncbi:MAG: SDR family NAD-dependent epimerase/dehydratase, partial [Planctomycetota bacterium]
SQTRSFCFVDDLVSGLVSLMNTDDDVTGPVNIGNPAEFTIKQLAELVLSLTESKSKLVFKNLPMDDPKMRRPDIGLANDLLGWSPTIPLEEGISRSIPYFRDMVTQMNRSQLG